MKGANLVSPWRRRPKRTKEEEEKAQRPDEIWATDLMYLTVGGRQYFLLSFLDEYSRQIVHHALAPNMEAATVSVEALAAIEKFLEERGGEVPVAGMPRLRSDNGSCYISREFAACSTSINSGISESSRIVPRRTGSSSAPIGRCVRPWRARS